MAMHKLIKNEKGVETTYHRIGSFNFNADTKILIVKIKEYVNESIRQIEKESFNHENTKQEKYGELNSLMDMERTNEVNDKVIKVSNEINKLNEIDMLIEEDLYVYETEIELFIDENRLSRNIIYNELKKLDRYKDSKDV